MTNVEFIIKDTIVCQAIIIDVDFTDSLDLCLAMVSFVIAAIFGNIN